MLKNNHRPRRSIKSKILSILIFVLLLSLTAHLGIFYYTTAHVKKMTQEVLAELHFLDNKADIKLKNEIVSKLMSTEFIDHHFQLANKEKAAYLVNMKQKFISFYNKINYITLTVFIVILFISYIIASCLAKTLTRPLTKLKNATQSLGHGYLADKVEISTGDEIEELADNFNQMITTQDNYLDKLCDSIEKEKIMESEIQLAAHIQKSSLPDGKPLFKPKAGVDLCAFIKPTKIVSGDFYDYFFIDHDHLFFALGDVSGKSMSAALFMMSSKLLIKKFALAGLSPDDVLKSVNDTLALDNPTCMYCTIFCGVLNTRTGHLEYCNAGHTPPLISSQNQFNYMNIKENMLVGLTSKAEFKAEKLDMQKNDMLFIYSDGITEAKNESDKLYSELRLLENIYKFSKDTPGSVIENIKKDVLNFSKNAEQYDDITMLCLAFRPDPVLS